MRARPRPQPASPKRPRDVGWRFLAAVLVAMFLALLAGGYARHEVGGSSTARPVAPAPALSDAGPFVSASSASGGDVDSAGVAKRTVALSFDDGPDPTWTPAVLDLLERHDVRATFFVVGARALEQPELVRRELEAGHEVGSHTFTHPNLASLPAWRQRLELSLTESALAGTAGVTSSLLRLPYSSEAATAGEADLAALEAAGDRGYLGVFSDRIGEDWFPIPAEAIVANAMPRDGEGAVVMLHDGGGNRARTLQALDQLIPALKAEGYRFVTASEAAGLAKGAAIAPAGTLPRARGLALLWAVRIGFALGSLLNMIVVPIMVLSLVRAALLVGLARRHAKRPWPHDEAFQPPVSVIVPAYNEEVGIQATIRSLAASRYPEFEIIVVDDGSTDLTAERVEELADPRTVLVRQPNGGKHSALNAGVARARHDVVVMIDGDTQFEPDTIRWLVAPLADPTIGAVSGNAKVGNRSGILGRWQHVEYVMGFNLDRRALDVIDALPIVPGAVGAFRRSAIEAVGGVAGDTLAEDGDLTMAMSRAGWRIVYEPRARAHTEAPATLVALWRQRYRWAYGTMQCMWKHRHAVARRDEGHFGRRALPYMVLFQVVLPFLGPLIDLFALYGLLFLDARSILTAWLGFALLQTLMGVYAFRLEGERLGPLWTLPLQQFVYRQMVYLVVIQSMRSALLGSRLRWHKPPRTGTVNLATAAATEPR
jgi:poly-beta-1,6 N-acetyl-D-glucosamine synthase